MNVSAESPGDISEIGPAEALSRQRKGSLLLDVREDDERAAGVAAGSIGLASGAIAQRIHEIAPDPRQEILAICGSGRRSRLAVETLRRLGYACSVSVSGGFARWRNEGLPVEQGVLDAD